MKTFFELFIPEKNVLGITSVILKDGTQYSTIPQPQDFITLGPDKWYEVQALVQDRVFVEDPADVLFTPLNDLEFKAIKTKGPEGPVDYYENKKLYLLRRLNGVSISQ